MLRNALIAILGISALSLAPITRADSVSDFLVLGLAAPSPCGAAHDPHQGDDHDHNVTRFNPPSYKNFLFLGNSAEEIAAEVGPETQRLARDLLAKRARGVCKFLGFSHAHLAQPAQYQPECDGKGPFDLIDVDEEEVGTLLTYGSVKSSNGVIVYPSFINLLECAKN